MHLLSLIRLGWLSIKRWDWRAIIGCLVTSLLFWILNALNNEHTATIKLPIQIVHYHENIIAVNKPPKELHLYIHGNGWAILLRTLGIGVQPMDIHIEEPLNLHYLTTKNLLPQINDFLKGVQVQHVVEDTILFEFNSIIEKEVVLMLDYEQLSLKENYKIDSEVQISPRSVKVRGAASILERQSDTLKICVDEVNIDGNIDQKIELREHISEEIEAEPKVVNLRFDVAPYYRHRMPAKYSMINFPRDSVVSLSPDTMEIIYYTKTPEPLSNDSLTVFFNYRDINRKQNNIKPRVIKGKQMIDFQIFPYIYSIKIDKK